MSEARVAVYYAPQNEDPLFAAGASWLGRDPKSEAATPQPGLSGIEEITAEPRRYGFHATLKPPMRQARGTTLTDVAEAARSLADRIAPFDLPQLAVTDLHGFLALRETEPAPALQALADICVAELDCFRAPPSADELARRRRAGLSPVEDALLTRWGYPYVFGAWFFHMTLTRRLSAAEHALWRPATETYFARALALPRRVADLCLFTQSDGSTPFRLAVRIPLRG